MTRENQLESEMTLKMRMFAMNPFPAYFKMCIGAILIWLPLAAIYGQDKSTGQSEQDARQLVAVLANPRSSTFDKAKACQRLAVIGDRDAIPALAALLADETLNLYARFGLEGIPDPAVNATLRDAATKLEGRQLVGVIDSIGKRRDVEAIDQLKDFLSHEDSAVVTVTASSLGRIGTEKAADALMNLVKNDRSKAALIADGCLMCAENLTDAGKNDVAVAMYRALADAEVPKSIQVAALQGQLPLLKPAEARELVLAELRSSDDTFFNLGLALARRLPGAESTSALVAELDTLTPDRKALLLLAIGDRQESPPLEVILNATQAEHAEIREAAIRVLARSDDPAAVPILLDAAIAGGPIGQLALDQLKRSSAGQLDQTIIAALSKTDDAKAKVALFDLVGSRRIAGARQAVEEALDHRDAKVATAAMVAFAQLADLDDLKLLVSPALSGGNAEKVASAQAALRTAAMRMTDRDACATALASHLDSASPEGKTFLLELLARLGGQKALQTVVANAKSSDPALKDASTRVLGDWPNAEAADVLIEMARKDSDEKYRIRAIRGYLRIARQFQLSPEERIAMFKAAMEVARRDEDKQLALSVLSRAPTEASLELATSHLKTPSLRDAAAEAALAIAPRLLPSNPKAVAVAMQKVAEAGVEGSLQSRAKQLQTQAQQPLQK
jgi:HEAT repeat protein